MQANWQSIAVLVIVGLAGLVLVRALWRALKAFQQSGKGGACPPGCSCREKKRG